jgi:hypothetical protein
LKEVVHDDGVIVLVTGLTLWPILMALNSRWHYLMTTAVLSMFVHLIVLASNMTDTVVAASLARCSTALVQFVRQCPEPGR